MKKNYFWTKGEFCKTWASKVARRNGWYDEICSHMIKPNLKIAL